MANAAELRAQLAELRAIRANGALRVEHGERSVTYRSDAELRAAIADIERRLAVAEGGSRPRTILLHTSKGL